MRPTIIDAARRATPSPEVVARTGIDCHQRSSPATVRCPFPTHGHFDRTPSLYLHLDTGLFFCFGCGVMGDVVEWVSRSEEVGWREAIDILDTHRPLTNAWASGAASPYPSSGGMLDTNGPGRPEGPDLARTPASLVFDALEAAWEYYTFSPLHDRGSAYLWGRGIDVGVLEARTGRREVGHTPVRAEGLVVALHARGFTTDELIDAGSPSDGEAHRSPTSTASGSSSPSVTTMAASVASSDATWATTDGRSTRTRRVLPSTTSRSISIGPSCHPATPGAT